MQSVIFTTVVCAAHGALTQHQVVDAPPEVVAKFTAFVQLHGRTYETDSDEYHMRLSHFTTRHAAVEAHNQRSDRTWTAGVNPLADRTPEELAMLRGYRHVSKQQGSAGSLNLASISAHVVNTTHLPANFTWKGQLKAMEEVMDQGACGSCWAVSSATVLRAHSELYRTDRTFSAQQILECTPNPRACGGTGGCKGATAELAMDFVARFGSATAEDVEYLGEDKACPSSAAAPKQNFLSSKMPDASEMTEVSLSNGGGTAFGMTGWRKLPENKADALLLSLYEEGPAVVSVAATDAWSMYEGGVLNGCDKDAVINHAVALVGYGEENGLKFWQIQNSWGPLYGEGGFIRLQRLDSHEESGFCGWDHSPQDGTACKGGPDKVYVCGQCGVLYDSVVPKFTLADTGLMAKSRKISVQV